MGLCKFADKVDTQEIFSCCFALLPTNLLLDSCKKENSCIVGGGTGTACEDNLLCGKSVKIVCLVGVRTEAGEPPKDQRLDHSQPALQPPQRKHYLGQLRGKCGNCASALPNPVRINITELNGT